MDDLTQDDVRRARAAAQRLHRPAATAVSDVVAALLAVQAQDVAAAPLALRARATGLTASAVERARADRSIVRAWGPRGTLHLVAAPDVGWLVPLTGPGQVTGAIRRLAQEGVSGTAATLVPVVERVLAGQGPLTKAEFAERLAATTRVVAKGQGLVHLLGLAAAHGKVVLGPDRGPKPTYVHAEDWLGAPLARPTDRGRALAELVRRYLRGHAPATPEDLVAWSGLSIRDIRAGWAAVAGDLVEVRHDGRPLWRIGRTRPADVAVALLPAFDELLLGWRDRSLILDPTHTRAVLPGGGILRPVVVARGRIAGTWRGATVDLFDPLDAPPVDPAGLSAEQADIARFLAG